MEVLSFLVNNFIQKIVKTWLKIHVTNKTSVMFSKEFR